MQVEPSSSSTSTPRRVSSLRQSGDDPVQHRLQRFVGWRGYFDELRRTFGAAPVHAVQHQAMQRRGAIHAGRREQVRW